MITPEYLEQFLVSGAAHAASAMGIIESAHQLGIDAVSGRRQRLGDNAVRPTVQHLAAENAIDVSASRAIFGRALQLLDRYYADHPCDRGAIDEANAIFSEVQQAKAFVNQAALRVVDRAMTMAGGSAYTASHPLSRLYRDARAGAFMHPLGANVAYEYIGAVALGMRPISL
jgi:alkylation response protein AidB-like acyl-CoA dehydrogenase